CDVNATDHPCRPTVCLPHPRTPHRDAPVRRQSRAPAVAFVPTLLLCSSASAGKVEVPHFVRPTEVLVGQLVDEGDRFAGAFHFRPELLGHFGELLPGEHRLLDGKADECRLERTLLSEGINSLAENYMGGDACDRNPGGLCHEWDRTRRARIRLDDVNLLVLNHYLDIHQSDDLQPPGDCGNIFVYRRNHVV